MIFEDMRLSRSKIELKNVAAPDGHFFEFEFGKKNFLQIEKFPEN